MARARASRPPLPRRRLAALDALAALPRPGEAQAAAKSEVPLAGGALDHLDLAPYPPVDPVSERDRHAFGEHLGPALLDAGLPPGLRERRWLLALPHAQELEERLAQPFLVWGEAILGQGGEELLLLHLLVRPRLAVDLAPWPHAQQDAPLLVLPSLHLAPDSAVDPRADLHLVRQQRQAALAHPAVLGDLCHLHVRVPALHLHVVQDGEPELRLGVRVLLCGQAAEEVLDLRRPGLARRCRARHGPPAPRWRRTAEPRLEQALAVLAELDLAADPPVYPLPQGHCWRQEGRARPLHLLVLRHV
mmetsp:Transcript_28351/g.90180  ORF Transcript_28351/g.90180 Transcript_28351/m.90180 type:complete len:304 (-) Transcript_28351:954-1865(-)